MKHYGNLYIGGRWVEPAQPDVLELIDPATEQPFATVAMGGQEDVDRAVRAARAAFPAYGASSAEQRIDLLQRIIEGLRSREDDLMAAITQELGCPSSLRIQARGSVGIFEDNVQLLREYRFETRMRQATIRREPIGVCGLISPWNWPLQGVVMKLASALAAGCAVVLKPSEWTPVTPIVLAEILHEAGVPAGVFNLVNGTGPAVGRAMCAHPDIDMVSFTGSTRTGILVAEAAAPTVKRVCQELGGKSANVVLPDADLAAAARWNVQRGFFNSSQSCHAPSRILVQRDQQQALVDLLVEEAGKLRVGDPREPDTTTGPVVSKPQFERIQRHIRGALEEGARLACGGPGRPAGLTRGYFVQPTIFADVTPSMTIAQEEIFGPVFAVMPYASEEEAIAIANGTPYGLGGYVFAGDLQRGRRVCERLRAGRIHLNGDPGDLFAPLGGYKRSGNGREMGVFGLEEYLEVKAMFGVPDAAGAP